LLGQSAPGNPGNHPFKGEDSSKCVGNFRLGDNPPTIISGTLFATPQRAVILSAATAKDLL
jgi:hypothetical protein